MWNNIDSMTCEEFMDVNDDDPCVECERSSEECKDCQFK